MKLLSTCLVVLSLSFASLAEDKLTHAFGVVACGTMATIGYIEGAKCKQSQPKVYINVVAVIYSIKTLGHIIGLAKAD